MRYGIAQWPFVSRWRVYLFALLLAAITILAYRPAWNGGFLWDDDAYVTNNELLTAPDGLRRIWFSFDSPSQYFPLVYTTFRIERALWGLNPAGYHVVNVLLHVANALLVWRLLARLRVPGAWLAGAIFALHPVQVESVAWITERKNVLMGFLFYLGKLFWPSNLTFIYPRWIVSPTHPLQYAWLAALGGVCAAICFARRYVGRSLEVAALFFVATLSPVLGFIMLYTFRYTFVADHYQYLASIGPIALASAGITTLAASFKESRHFIFGAAVCLLVALTMFTWRQSTIYSDIEALWRTTIARNPGCWMAHNNLGIVLSQKGEIDEAIAHYRKTLEMSPDFAEADYNLGNALLQKGEVDAAIIHCQRAVTIQPNDPEAQVALGNALFQKGLIDESIVHYQKALAIRPYYVTAHYNLSSDYLKKGEIEKEIFHCQ